MKARRSWRGWLFSTTLAVAAVCWMAGTSPQSPTAFRAIGSIALTSDGGGAALFPASMLTPGHPATSCIEVQRSATDGEVYMGLEGGTGSLLGYLKVVVAMGTGGVFGDCSQFQGATIYSGNLAGLEQLDPSGATGVPTGWSSPTDTDRSFEVTVSVADTNSAQDGQASGTFVWTLVAQQANPAVASTAGPASSTTASSTTASSTTGAPGTGTSTTGRGLQSGSTSTTSATSPVPSIPAWPVTASPGAPGTPATTPGTPATTLGTPRAPTSRPGPSTTGSLRPATTATRPEPGSSARGTTAGPVPSTVTTTGAPLTTTSSLPPSAPPGTRPGRVAPHRSVTAPARTTEGGGASPNTGGGSPGAGGGRGGHGGERGSGTGGPSPKPVPAQPRHRAGRSPASVLNQVVATARRVAGQARLPITLFAVLAGFLFLQGRLDRRDPKLALAPMGPEPSLRFDDTPVPPRPDAEPGPAPDDRGNP